MNDIINLISSYVPIVLLSFVIIYSIKYYWRCYTAPPGNWGIPFLGVLPYTLIGYLLGHEDNIDKTWTELALKMAPRGVLSACLGTQRIVILHSYDAIHEALIEKPELFVNRPQHEFFQQLSGGRGLILSNGNLWKQQRRFTMQVLRNLGFGKSLMEERILLESDFLCKFIDEAITAASAASSKNTKVAVNPLYFSVRAVSNIISQLVFGERWDYHEEAFEQSISNVRTVTQIGGPMAFLTIFFPEIARLGLLRLVPNHTGDQIFESLKELNAVLLKKLTDSEINMKIKREEEGKMNSWKPASFMEAFLYESEKENVNHEIFTREQCVQASLDLFIAGSDTTTNSLCWTLLFLAKYPMVQVRLYKEIIDIIMEQGINQINQYELRNQMPYTQAVMDEVQRFASIVPRAIDKQAIHDVEFRGYLIRPDDVVVTHLYHIHHDPQLWTEPERFDPDRFLTLSADGKTLKYEASKYLFPFGLGKRSCLGESLAKMEYFLFLTNMILNYRFELTEKTQKEWSAILLGTRGIIHAPLDFELNVARRS